MSSGDSVHSGRSQTRYSTPVPELDDHRTRGRLNSVPVVEIDRSDSPPGQEAIRRGSVDGLNTLGVYDGPIARDFENAIVEDDDESIRSAARRQTSFNPMVRRETVTRRSRVHEERNNEHSRDSSPSSQSSSPPNSVDAFADPRRRGRANTLDSHSQRPSELDGILRTHSIATQRRPTFSNESLIRVPEGVPSILEEDDDDRRLIIDYEELEEFVALSQQKKVNDLQLGRKNSNIPHHARVFHDVRARVDRDDACNPEELPMALKVNTSETFHDEKSDDAMQEKLALLEPKADKQRTRFSFFSSECPDAIHATQLGDLLLEGERFRDLFEPNPDGGVWWLDVNNPTEEELHTLGRAFSMHPLTSEDIIMQESREKVELFDAYYFVCFRSYVMDKKSEEFLDSINIYMVVWREGVLSFSFSDTPHVDNVRRRSGKLRNQFSLSSDWICYAMIDNIVDCFAPIIREIELETESIEDEVFISRAEDFNEFLPRIGEVRKKVMSLMRLLGGKADVIKGFAKRCNTEYRVTPRGDIGVYLGDVQDHVVTMMSNLGHFEKMLSRSHANYLAQLSFTNLTQSNNTNANLSKITVIATILVPLNLICGLFGMNVQVPGKDDESYAWFFGIIGVIALFVVTSLGLARRFKYI